MGGLLRNTNDLFKSVPAWMDGLSRNPATILARSHLAIVINSHKRNFRSQRVAVASIPSPLHSRVVVAVGGSDREGLLTREDGVWHLHVRHNSLDFTGLIAAVEHRKQLLDDALGVATPGFLYLHDTIVFGPRTPLLLAQFFGNYSLNHSRALAGSKKDRYIPSMNMGFYTFSMLDRVADELLRKWRGPVANPQLRDLHAQEITLKKHHVGAEGMMFRIYHRMFLDGDSTCEFVRAICRPPQVVPNASFTYNGSRIKRRVLYFHVLDLTKYQANYFWRAARTPNYAMEA